MQEEDSLLTDWVSRMYFFKFAWTLRDSVVSSQTRLMVR